MTQNSYPNITCTFPGAKEAKGTLTIDRTVITIKPDVDSSAELAKIHLNSSFSILVQNQTVFLIANSTHRIVTQSSDIALELHADILNAINSSPENSVSEVYKAVIADPIHGGKPVSLKINKENVTICDSKTNHNLDIVALSATSFVSKVGQDGLAVGDRQPLFFDSGEIRDSAHAAIAARLACLEPVPEGAMTFSGFLLYDGTPQLVEIFPNMVRVLSIDTRSTLVASALHTPIDVEQEGVLFPHGFRLPRLAPGVFSCSSSDEKARWLREIQHSMYQMTATQAALHLTASTCVKPVTANSTDSLAPVLSHPGETHSPASAVAISAGDTPTLGDELSKGIGGCVSLDDAFSRAKNLNILSGATRSNLVRAGSAVPPDETITLHMSMAAKRQEPQLYSKQNPYLEQSAIKEDVRFTKFSYETSTIGDLLAFIEVWCGIPPRKQIVFCGSRNLASEDVDDMLEDCVRANAELEVFEAESTRNTLDLDSRLDECVDADDFDIGNDIAKLMLKVQLNK